MSDELAKNYEIFEINDEKYKYLVLRRFCHSFDQQWQSVEEELKSKGYKGWVLFDNLFKGGNISSRYVRQYFDKTFSGPALLETIPLEHPYRVQVSQYLKEYDYVTGTSLTQEDIDAVLEGKTI